MDLEVSAALDEDSFDGFSTGQTIRAKELFEALSESYKNDDSFYFSEIALRREFQ
jgi:hypothetical protein